MQLRWTDAATKHGISQSRARHVIEHYHPALVQPATPPERPDEQNVYLGDDGHGVPLEVMTVALGGGVELVIHVMQLRATYLSDYRKRVMKA